MNRKAALGTLFAVALTATTVFAYQVPQRVWGTVPETRRVTRAAKVETFTFVRTESGFAFFKSGLPAQVEGFSLSTHDDGSISTINQLEGYSGTITLNEGKVKTASVFCGNAISYLQNDLAELIIAGSDPQDVPTKEGGFGSLPKPGLKTRGSRHYYSNGHLPDRNRDQVFVFHPNADKTITCYRAKERAK